MCPHTYQPVLSSYLYVKKGVGKERRSSKPPQREEVVTVNGQQWRNQNGEEVEERGRSTLLT